jgi:hypothetical protein
MSFDGGVTETKFALGQMPEMSALNCSAWWIAPANPSSDDCPWLMSICATFGSFSTLAEYKTIEWC